MKKATWAIGIIILLAFMGTPAWAAIGSCTVAYEQSTPAIQIATVTCTGGTAGEAGTVTSPTIIMKKGWIFLLETNPGGTAPTTLYDMVLNNSEGVDVVGGALMNRSATLTERAVPAIVGWVDGPLTMVVTNNSVASSTWTVKIFLYGQYE